MFRKLWRWLNSYYAPMQYNAILMCFENRDADSARHLDDANREEQAALAAFMGDRRKKEAQ